MINPANMSLNEQIARLDRMLNDPDVDMAPEQVWALVAEISRLDTDHAAGNHLP